ncbi:pentapeptide repeat-containing protein [Clostridium sp. B9]|uniref:pentapeptide repeat-containing protein n=1 Tax=Clostridium sp. B9 TaxID=3423224 RepID=UPI003D2EEA1B
MFYEDKSNLFSKFNIDCRECFGFCCVALYFSKCDGFPVDKVAGKPCVNLNKDFTCKIHKSLREKGLKGCTSYDCFGAGQKVAKETYKGESWIESKGLSQEIFDSFLVMRQLYEMLWYLTEAYTMEESISIRKDIKCIIDETEELTGLEASDLLNLDVEKHRERVNLVLRKVSNLVIKKYNTTNKNISKNLIGKNLKKSNLRGADLRGSLLIAADLGGCDLSGTNFQAADMRDVNLKGADLSKSVFLTQSQINTAIGDNKTKLPPQLKRPPYWEK